MSLIEVQNAEVLDLLERLRDRLDNLTPALDAIGQRMEERISMRFETESDPLGRPWKPWAESTRRSYPKDGHGRLLDRYGDMLGSLSHQVDGDSVLVGFGQPYAAYHEHGTDRMDRRGLLFADPDAGELGEDDANAVIEVIAGYLDPARP